MSQHGINSARKLIKQKRYDDARDILLQLDHPTADRWLSKLDDIDPPLKLKHYKDTPSVSIWSLLRAFIVVGLTVFIFTRNIHLDLGVILIFSITSGLALINLFHQLSNYRKNNHG